MAGRWHHHLTWACGPRENTLPCAWWGNPLTPYKTSTGGTICISHGFPGEMEFSPTSSQYPAQNRVAARAGFCDEWEKTPSLLETMRNAFSPMLRCVAKILPIIIRRCIYWCQSAEMEISPTCLYRSLAAQRSTGEQVSSPGKN